VWDCGLEAGPATIFNWSSWHLPRVATEELKAPVDVVLPEVTPFEADLYPEHPIKVLDQKDCVTRQKTIKFFKREWSNHSEKEATGESEDFLRSRHPNFVLP
jgi:hypothetical protein